MVYCNFIRKFRKYNRITKNMKRVLTVIGIVAVAIVISLLGMKIPWILKDKKVFSVYILDKTVTQTDRNEHKSFTWILNQNKYVLPGNRHYSHKTDYFGFFPIDLQNGEFDFKSIRINEIDQFAATSDMVFYADCFGVHAQGWSNEKLKSERTYQRIYGGLNQNDFLLLKEMLDQGKPAIVEYNLFSSPTNALVRTKTEELLSFAWSGWSGRYYSNFDVNADDGPPVWMKNLYESQHHGAWPESESGIVLVHNDELIEILRLGAELNSAIPTIESNQQAIERFGVAQNVKFEQWFEFIDPTDNVVHSHFQLDVTPRGKEVLEQLGLTEHLPAVIEGKGLNYFYFCGNFSENPSVMWTSKLAGGQWINLFFSRFQNPNKAKFFYGYYTPIIQTVLREQLNMRDSSNGL